VKTAPLGERGAQLQRRPVGVVEHRERGAQGVATPVQRGGGGRIGAGQVGDGAAGPEHLAGQLGGQPRLADAVGAAHRHDAAASGPRGAPVLTQQGERGVAAGEPRRAPGVERPGQLARRGRQLERRVLPEDRGVQAPELRPGLDPEPLHERVPRPAVDVQRLGLVPAAIEREHELGREALARRVLREQPPQLADDRRMPPGAQVGLHARLQRGDALLLEAPDLGLGERRELQSRQRWAAPQRQGVAQHARRALGVARGERLAAGRQLALEALGVGLVGLHHQPVSRRRGLEQAGAAECLAQARHVDLQRLHRAGRRLLAPQREGQLLGAHRPVGAQRQYGEQRARLGAAESQRAVAGAHLERTEEPDFHRCGLWARRYSGADRPAARIRLRAIAAAHRSGRSRCRAFIACVPAPGQRADPSATRRRRCAGG
jgi:hypothetical protein